MRNVFRYGLLAVVVVAAGVMSGCTVRTYPLTKDRIDQDLTAGNRGYVQGEVPAMDDKERKPTRRTQVFEIELGRQLKVESCAKTPAQEPMNYREESDEPMRESSAPRERISSVQYQQYTVQKGDTLQKISQKMFGTTKKWAKIYDANRDALKGPNNIYPGQVINIPVEGMKEPAANLK